MDPKPLITLMPTPTPDPERGLIITHGVLLALVTLLFGPLLWLSFYLGQGYCGKWRLTHQAWGSLMGNMISGVIMGIVIGSRKHIDFANPHLALGIILFTLTIVVATTPFIPERYIRNDLQRYGVSTNKLLSFIATVVWALAASNIMIGVRLSHEPRKTYVVYGTLIGVSFISCLFTTLWLMRKASIKERQETSRARDIVGT